LRNVANIYLGTSQPNPYRNNYINDFKPVFDVTD